MSSRKSRFLRMEHALEAEMSWWVTKLERELESTHCESQDRAVEVTEVRATALLAVERGLEAAKVRQAEAEAAL